MLNWKTESLLATLRLPISPLPFSILQHVAHPALSTSTGRVRLLHLRRMETRNEGGRLLVGVHPESAMTEKGLLVKNLGHAIREVVVG